MNEQLRLNSSHPSQVKKLHHQNAKTKRNCRGQHVNGGLRSAHMWIYRQSDTSLVLDERTCFSVYYLGCLWCWPKKRKRTKSTSNMIYIQSLQSILHNFLNKKSLLKYEAETAKNIRLLLQLTK